jgi:F-type H+-transporting ATPase subunit a
MVRTTAAAALLLGSGATAAFASVDIKASPIGPVTNSIITSWVVTLVIILLFKFLVGKPGLVPSRGQALVEGAVDGLRGLYEPIVGKKAMPMAFPLLICLFFFIVLHNWSGLLPGVGTIGWRLDDGTEHGHFLPFIRPHTADFNGTLALALISFGGWFILVMRYAGPKLLLFDLFGNKADKKELPGVIYYGLGLIFLVVGLIEVVSIFIRPVTLSVRLFGNIFGGESLLHGTSFAFPFYFLELLVGFVQALVFTLLTSVYVGLICNHGDDHDHDDHGHGEHKEASH